MDVDELIEALIDREGGYVSHPADRGLRHHADAAVPPAPAARAESAIHRDITHPRRDHPSRMVARSSPIHAARLTVSDGQLIADRDIVTPQRLLGDTAAEATASAERTT